MPPRSVVKSGTYLKFSPTAGAALFA